MDFKTQKFEERKNREQEEIFIKNLKIQVALKENMKSRKKYKKEVEKNIENYLNLRDRISKLKIKMTEKVRLSSIEGKDAKSSNKKHKRFMKKLKTLRSKSKGQESVHSIKQTS
jgi:hypothetical protein